MNYDCNDYFIARYNFQSSDEAIRDVTNITCVIYDQKSELTCVWDLGLYHHPCFLRFNANL